MSTTIDQLTADVQRLAQLAEAVVEGFPQDSYGDLADTQEWADHYGIDLDDPDDPPTGEDLSELLRDAHDESILSIDTVTVVSVVYGTGGPHTEIEITLSPEGEALRGRALGYWGGDKVERHLAVEVAEEYAAALCLSEYATAYRGR